jgi:hypothetical protein
VKTSLIRDLTNPGHENFMPPYSFGIIGSHQRGVITFQEHLTEGRMPPPNPFAKIKGHVEGKWLAEVYQDDRWLPVEDWSAVYEPKKVKKADSAQQAERKAKFAAKAKETILSKLQVGISAKLILLVLEAASKVLNQIEAKLVGAGPPQDLVNHVSAILLTYRFVKSKKMNKKKAAFLRSTAVDHLAHGIGDMGDQLSQAQKLLRGELSGVQNVRSIVSDKLDEILSMAKDKVTDAEAKVEAVADEAEAILRVAGIERPPVPEKHQLKAQKEDMVRMLSAVIKDAILSKLDSLAQTISSFMDNLFVVSTLAMAKARSSKDPSKLRTTLSNTVDEMHTDLEEAIRGEVARVVLLIGSMTEKSDDNEEDGEEEQN